MNIGIIINTRSGRNKAAHFSLKCQQLLSKNKHHVTVFDTTQPETAQNVWDTDRIIIIGGDGTVHHSLPKLISTQIPFYHLATGTSNLIAKELRMPRIASEAVRWIEQGGNGQLDAPTIDSVPFLIMCCIGIDAGIIHRFQTLRKKSGGFRNYILPVIQEILAPRPAKIQITVDGQQVSIDSPQNLLIANMRSYALGLDPCHEANSTDSTLDILAVPCRTGFQWTLHNSFYRIRRQPPSAIRLLSRTISITAHGNSPSLVQMDGEIARTPNMPSGLLESGVSIDFCIGNQTVIPLRPPPNSQNALPDT